MTTTPVERPTGSEVSWLHAFVPGSYAYTSATGFVYAGSPPSTISSPLHSVTER